MSPTAAPPTPAFGGFNFNGILSSPTSKETSKDMDSKRFPLSSQATDRNGNEEEYTPPSPSAYPIGMASNLENNAPSNMEVIPNDKMDVDDDEKEEGELSEGEEYEPPAINKAAEVSSDLGEQPFNKQASFNPQFHQPPHSAHPSSLNRGYTFDINGRGSHLPHRGSYSGETNRRQSVDVGKVNPGRQDRAPAVAKSSPAEDIFRNSAATIEARVIEGRKLAQKALLQMILAKVPYESIEKGNGVHPLVLAKTWQATGVPFPPKVAEALEKANQKENAVKTKESERDPVAALDKASEPEGVMPSVTTTSKVAAETSLGTNALPAKPPASSTVVVREASQISTPASTSPTPNAIALPKPVGPTQIPGLSIPALPSPGIPGLRLDIGRPGITMPSPLHTPGALPLTPQSSHVDHQIAKRKRPVAADFVETKRKFGALRSNERLVLDISEDDFSDGDSMYGDSDKPGPGKSTTPPSVNNGRVQPNGNGNDLTDRLRQIEEMKRRIKEAEAKKKLKNGATPSGCSTPASETTTGAQAGKSLAPSPGKSVAKSTAASPAPIVASSGAGTPVDKTSIIQERMKKLEEERKRKKAELAQREEELRRQLGLVKRSSEGCKITANGVEIETREYEQVKASRREEEAVNSKNGSDLIKLKEQLRSMEASKMKMAGKLEQIGEFNDIKGTAQKSGDMLISNEPTQDREAPQQQAAELLKGDEMQVGEERQSPSSMDTDSSQSITSDSSSDSESMDTDDNQSEVEQSKTPIPNGIQSASTFPTNQTGVENSLPSNKADKMDIDERSERSSDSESSDSSSSALSSPSSSRAPSESRAGLSAKEQPSENVDSKDPEMTGVQSVMQNYPQIFTPYSSPLSVFKSFRLHPKFQEFVKGGYLSLTYSNQINPTLPFCTFEFNNGHCNDQQCGFQHWRNTALSEQDLMLQLGFVIEGETEEQKQEYRTGLGKLISEMRENGITQFIEILNAIGKYRREFLKDPTVVLDLTPFSETSPSS